MPHQAPEFPAGAFEAPVAADPARIAADIEVLGGHPRHLRDALRGLSAEQLATRYRNWSVRQIAHHVADSHMNSLVRWKLALTEDRPTVKPYDENDWVRLADSAIADPLLAADLLDALQARWTIVLKAMSPADFTRTFHHPIQKADVPLWRALAYYAWHGTHHIGQINWLRLHYRW